MAKFRYFRYILALIAFIGMAVVNMTRSDFNVTILKMINHSTNCNDSGSIPTPSNMPNGNIAAIYSNMPNGMPSTFCWSVEIEELLVASYFIGYMFQVPGGYLATMFGAHYVCGFSMLVTVVLSFLTPLAARDWRVLFALRVVQGLGASVTYPAMTAMWTKWAPENEKTTLFAIMSTGHFVGAALADIVSGILCDEDNALGGYWPSVFMVFGIIGMIWFVLWMTFVSSDPERNVWISSDEKGYIEENRVPLRRNRSTPWLWILTSSRCWAIYIAHFCSYFGYLNMLICYPQYFKDVKKMDIQKLGIVSSIPIISMFVMAIISGRVTDMLLARNVMSRTVTRKVNTAIGMIIPAALNFVIAYVPDLSSTEVITLMALQSAANAFVLSGFQVNYMDINPDHAGITMGVGNTIASTAGIAVPLILYRFDKQNGGKAATEWKYMFTSVGIIMTIGALVFCILGTGKRQQEGMEGYEEIAALDRGTDSGAEETTNRKSSNQTSSAKDTSSAKEASSCGILGEDSDALLQSISEITDNIAI